MTVASGLGWTEERIEALKAAYAEGLSASQIAKLLGGITRNAVIGKLHRMGLIRDTLPKAAPRLKAHQPAAPRVISAPIEPPMPKTRVASNGRVTYDPPPDQPLPRMPLAPVPETAVAFFNRRPDQCAWCVEPFEAPAHAFMMVCGAVVEEDRPYCAHHNARARGRPTDHRIIKPPFEKTVVRVAA